MYCGKKNQTWPWSSTKVAPDAPARPARAQLLPRCQHGSLAPPPPVKSQLCEGPALLASQKRAKQKQMWARFPHAPASPSSLPHRPPRVPRTPAFWQKPSPSYRERRRKQMFPPFALESLTALLAKITIEPPCFGSPMQILNLFDAQEHILTRVAKNDGSRSWLVHFAAKWTWRIEEKGGKKVHLLFPWCHLH